MLRILHFCPIPSFLRIAVILLQQLSRLWFSGLFTVTINFEKFRIVWNCVELCGIPFTWDWTITKLTQGNRTPIKDDTQLRNIYLIIIYFYNMSVPPILFFGPTCTETSCRLMWEKGEVYLRARKLSPPDLVLCTPSLLYIDHVQ